MVLPAEGARSGKSDARNFFMISNEFFRSTVFVPLFAKSSGETKEEERNRNKLTHSALIPKREGKRGKGEKGKWGMGKSLERARLKLDEGQ